MALDRLPPHRADPTPRLPAACGIAFKEWAGVCAALAEGRQTLILRKGGIAEGPQGFAPEHPVFWLYPTFVHQAEQGLRRPAGPSPAAVPDPDPDPDPGTVALDALVLVDSIVFVDREEALAALGDWHVWTEETVARRFHYRKPGLWVLGVRVFRRAVPWRIAVTAEHAGCKTWVPLDPPLETAGCRPVLDLAEFTRRRDQLQAALHATDVDP
jgi:hypothetical protein